MQVNAGTWIKLYRNLWTGATKKCGVYLQKYGCDQQDPEKGE